MKWGRAATPGTAWRNTALAAGAVLTLTTFGPAAVADPAPSAREVAKSKAAVRDRAADVGRIKARLAQANGELEQLAVRAEAAVERYNGELVKLERARQAYLEAQRRLAEAERNHELARTEMAEFAANAYRMNTGYHPWAGMLAGSGGPQGAMDRAGMVEVMAHRQTGVMERVKAAQNIADMFRKQAAAALREQQAAMRRAAEAKRAAENAVAGQRAAVQRISVEKRGLEKLLGAARLKAERLADKRTEALAAAAAARAAREAQSSGGGGGRLNRGSGRSYAGLAQGSGRGSMVVRAALKWLGTPYSWGGGTASGPSYGIEHGAGIKGFDCSGLALYAWAKAGVRLDHWTGTQWTSGPHVPNSMLRAGDLVFFANNTNDPDTIHHVGIYLGRGQMVEAPYTGAQVRISTIWRNGFIGATRPAG